MSREFPTAAGRAYARDFYFWVTTRDRTRP